MGKRGDAFRLYCQVTGQEAAAARSHLRALRVAARSHGVAGLLATATGNPKLKKSLGLGAYTCPLHLSPADISGFETCAMRTAGCTAGCLNTAGNPNRARSKRRARNNRTRFYFQDRRAFLGLLLWEVCRHVARTPAGMVCGLRLNATSDIPWERVSIGPDATGSAVTYRNIMEAFSPFGVVFYDYTKRANRVKPGEYFPRNYFLTFSLAEGNEAAALRALRSGLNVAVVFDVRRGRPLPPTFELAGTTVPVIDGDLHDYRPADPVGVVVGLRAKGPAIGDTSGFVRPASPAPSLSQAA